MATPLGHALAGYAVGRLGARSAPDPGRLALALCVVLAVAPDLDFLPGILSGQPALYHQGISHSFVFGLVVTGAAAIGIGLAVRRLSLSTFGLLFAAYASHLLIDLFGPDFRPPFGIPLFWPLDHGYYRAPFEIFLGVRHAATASTPTGEWIAAVLHWHNVKAILREAAVLAPLALVAELRHRRGQGQRRAALADEAD